MPIYKFTFLLLITFGLSLDVLSCKKDNPDNREATYVATGTNSETAILDAANNKSNTACANEIQPDADGNITVTITSGSNNTNDYGFFILT